MKQLTNKEYEEWQKHKSDATKGRILTQNGLHTICAAYEYDPEKIDKHFLELLPTLCPEENK